MTLDQLRIFIAVAERQHVTRASEYLNLGQSAVSSAISSLEARHSVKLFNRVGRRIELTEAGMLFLPEARAVLDRAEAAKLALSELGGLKTGTLTIQASQTIASYWLPGHLVAFKRSYPGIDLKLTIGNTAQVASAVREGIAELGFVEGAVNDAVLSTEVVAQDTLIIVVAPSHEWARIPPRLDQLKEGNWILREPGSGTRSAFEDGLRSLHFDPKQLNIVMELPANESIRAAVEAGFGAAALSESVAEAGLHLGLLHKLSIALPERQFCVLRHSQRYASKAGQLLINAIRGSSKGAVGSGTS